MRATPRWMLAALCVLPSGCHLATVDWNDLGEARTRAGLEGATILDVATRVGSVTVLPAEDADVQVQARVRVRETHVDAHSVADAGRDVRVTREEDRLVIRDAHLGRADEDDWAVDLTVWTPPVARVVVRTEVGDVLARTGGADVDAKVDVGSIRVEGSPARVDLHAGVGSLALLAPAVQAADLQTDVGAILIQLKREFPGSLDLSTDVGDLEVPASVTGVRVRDVVSASLQRTVPAGPLLRARTEVGAIRYRLDPAPEDH